MFLPAFDCGLKVPMPVLWNRRRDMFILSCSKVSNFMFERAKCINEVSFRLNQLLTHHSGVWHCVSSTADSSVIKNSRVLAINLNTFEMQLVSRRVWFIWITVVQCFFFSLEESLLESLRVDHGWPFISNGSVFIWGHIAMSLTNFVIY